MNGPMKRPWKTSGKKDAKALEEAFIAYRPTLLCYLSARIGSREDAQDIAQEAYMRLQRVRDPARIERPESYFFQIVKNLASEYLVKRGARPKFIDLDTLMQIGADRDAYAGEVELEACAAITHLNAILEDLPPLYRAVLLLRKRDGYSHAEISEKLGITKTTVRTYLTRALSRCFEKWEDN